MHVVEGVKSVDCVDDMKSVEGIKCILDGKEGMTWVEGVKSVVGVEGVNIIL